MKDDLLNYIIDDSTDNLTLEKADQRRLVQLTVIPVKKPRKREETQKHVELLNSVVDSFFLRAMSQSGVPQNRIITGAFFLGIQEDKLKNRFENMIRGVFSGVDTRVSLRLDGRDSAARLRSLARLKENEAINLDHVFLTVFSWNTDNGVMDTQTIHVLSEIEKRLAGMD